MFIENYILNVKRIWRPILLITALVQLTVSISMHTLDNHLVLYFSSLATLLTFIGWLDWTFMSLLSNITGQLLANAGVAYLDAVNSIPDENFLSYLAIRISMILLSIVSLSISIVILILKEYKDTKHFVLLRNIRNVFSEYARQHEIYRHQYQTYLDTKNSVMEFYENKRLEDQELARSIISKLSSINSKSDLKEEKSNNDDHKGVNEPKEGHDLKLGSKESQIPPSETVFYSIPNSLSEYANEELIMPDNVSNNLREVKVNSPCLSPLQVATLDDIKNLNPEEQENLPGGTKDNSVEYELGTREYSPVIQLPSKYDDSSITPESDVREFSELPKEEGTTSVTLDTPPEDSPTIRSPEKITNSAPLDVQHNTLHVPPRSNPTLLPLAVEASSNSLPVNVDVTPRDRGEGSDGSSIMGMMEDGANDVLDVTSGGLPAADLREAEGEVIGRSCLQDKDKVALEGGSTVYNTSTVLPVSDLRELEGELNRRADGRTVPQVESHLQDEDKVITSSGDDIDVSLVKDSSPIIELPSMIEDGLVPAENKSEVEVEFYHDVESGMENTDDIAIESFKTATEIDVNPVENYSSACNMNEKDVLITKDLLDNEIDLKEDESRIKDDNIIESGVENKDGALLETTDVCDVNDGCVDDVDKLSPIIQLPSRYNDG